MRTAKLERMSRRDKASLPWNEVIKGRNALQRRAMKDRREVASSASSWIGEKIG